MSSGDPKADMPDELVAYLEGGRLVVAATVDPDGLPYTMVMNSAIATDAHTIRFCIDHRTHSLKNIRENGRIMFEIIGDGCIYGVRGSARVVVEKMQHAPIPSAMVEVTVETVKRDLPPGVKITGPQFEWGALEQYMSPVEPKMFEEMRAYNS
jgi:hypothetical protein